MIIFISLLFCTIHPISIVQAYPLFATNSVISSIPDISGNWVGETFGGNGYVGPCNHFLYLQQSGNAITGTSKTYCPSIYNKQELTGSISNGIFSYTGKTIDKSGSLNTPDMIFRFSIIGTPPNKLDGTASSQLVQGFVYVTMNRETPLTQSTPVQTTLPTPLPTTSPPVTQFPLIETPRTVTTTLQPTSTIQLTHSITSQENAGIPIPENGLEILYYLLIGILSVGILYEGWKAIKQ